MARLSQPTVMTEWSRVQTVTNGITAERAYNLANTLDLRTGVDKLGKSHAYYINNKQKSKPQRVKVQTTCMTRWIGLGVETKKLEPLMILATAKQ